MGKDVKDVDRARQFLPFDALTGFSDEIKKMEQIKVEKPILMEDELELLEDEFRKIEVGKIVKIVYYADDAYFEKEGMISKINLEESYIQIVKTKIKLKDIVKISL